MTNPHYDVDWDGTDRGGVSPPAPRRTRPDLEVLPAYVAAAAGQHLLQDAAARRRKAMGHNAQCTGEEWAEARELIDVVKFVEGCGWNELSKLMGSSERGLSSGIYHVKSILRPEHLRALRKLVAELPKQRVVDARAALAVVQEHDPSAPRRKSMARAAEAQATIQSGVLTTEGKVKLVGKLVEEAAHSFETDAEVRARRQERAKEISDFIRSRPGGSWEKVSRVFGYNTVAGCSQTIRDGAVGAEKLARAEAWYARELQKPGEQERQATEKASLEEAVATRRLTNGRHEEHTEPAIWGGEVQAVEVVPAATLPPEPEPAPRKPRKPAAPAADTWDAIRADAITLAERIQTMANVPLPGLPAAVVKEARASIQRRADRLLEFIAEELEA